MQDLLKKKVEEPADIIVEIELQRLRTFKNHPYKDQLYFRDIKAALDYIFDHDKFRAAEKHDKDNVKYKNKKYQQQAEKRERRAKLRTVDQIFKELEEKDKELVKYSIC